MKSKLSLLAFLLLPSISSAIVSINPSGQCFTMNTNMYCGIPKGLFSSVYSVSSSPINGCGYTGYWISNLPADPQYDGVPAYIAVSTSCPSCSSGTVWDNASQSCKAPSLSSFNNNPTGCASAGGYYLADNTCVTGSQALARIFGDPLAVSGAFLFLNGFAWTAAGILALPITGGASGAAIAYGGHAMLIGAGMMAVSADGTIDFSSSTGSASNDSTSGETRLKVSLDDYQNTQVVKADTATGKVTDISTIPPDVKQRIIDGVVNPTTGEPNISPSDLAGTKTTHYDYSTNTATTQTVQSDGSISTQTTPITTVSNGDGTVTTSASDNTVAPTVTGTTGSTGVDPNWSAYSTIAQWTTTTADNGTGSGSTGTTDTGGGSSGGTSSGTDTNGDALYEGLSVDDGSGNFGNLTDTVSGQFDKFVVSLPWPACTDTLTFDPIGFDLLGQHFVLLDSSMLNRIPVDIFRAILMFVAVVSGLISVFAGGI